MTAPHERRRYLATLLAMAERRERSAPANVHAIANPARNQAGYRLKDEANAIRWALLQLDPMTEGPKQMLAEMAAE